MMVKKINNKTSWNKGLKMSEKHKQNHKLAMEKFRGENNPSKRLEVREKISKAKMGHKGYKYWLGKRRSEETKRKISISKKGTIPWNKDKKMSEEFKETISKAIKKRLEEGEVPGNYKHGNSRKHKNGKPYSHFVWCSQPQNLSYVPKGFVIHHRDMNPHNNQIDNLLLISRSDHTKNHMSKFIKEVS